MVATVAGFGPVTFTATAKATPDLDGDGETGFSDFSCWPTPCGSDPRIDLDGRGTSRLLRLLFADQFADPARGILLALARERLGLQDEP